MADTPGPAGGTSRSRIDMRSRDDVERWTRELGVSAEELAKVIEIVGDDAARVADYIAQEGRPATSE